MIKPQEAKTILENAGLDDEKKWKQAINTLLLDVVNEHAATRLQSNAVTRRVKQTDPLFEVLQQHFGMQPSNGAAGATPTPIGADSDVAQMAAEAAMNAAAGPRGVSLPPPAAATPVVGATPGKQVPPRGGVRVPVAHEPSVSGNGTPTFNSDDPAQVAAEAAMEAAAGPRSSP